MAGSIEIKRDSSADIVLNNLFRLTPMQTSFGVNMLALNGGRPELMTLKDLVGAFVAFREEVVTRRTRFDLGKARERGHTLVGLAVAVANIDEVIKLIRAAPDAAANATSAICAALIGRSRHGRGDVIDLCLLDSAIGALGNTGVETLTTGTQYAVEHVVRIEKPQVPWAESGADVAGDIQRNMQAHGAP